MYQLHKNFYKYVNTHNLKITIKSNLKKSQLQKIRNDYFIHVIEDKIYRYYRVYPYYSDFEKFITTVNQPMIVTAPPHLPELMDTIENLYHSWDPKYSAISIQIEYITGYLKLDEKKQWIKIEFTPVDYETQYYTLKILNKLATLSTDDKQKLLIAMDNPDTYSLTNLNQLSIINDFEETSTEITDSVIKSIPKEILITYLLSHRNTLSSRIRNLIQS